MSIFERLGFNRLKDDTDFATAQTTSSKSYKNKPTIINKGSVLIGVGCSHTQGCAFTTNQLNVEEHELASEQLKKKYKKDKVDAKFITNLSWVGKLGELLKSDKVYNFGVGGWGFESCIRALRSYIFKVKDLKNHTIVIQIPHPTRKEATYKENNEPPAVEIISNITDFKSRAPYKEAYLEHYVDFENIEGNLVSDLYFLQDYLESKGATVRFIDHPFIQWSIQTTNQSESYKDGYKKWIGKAYHKFEMEMPGIPELYSRLNVIDLSEFYNLEDRSDLNSTGTLHHEGLLDNDKHYSETGNIRLANYIFNYFNKPYQSRIFATLPENWEVIRKKKLI